MKTDKELLELAAKAAGIDIDYRHGSDSFYYDDEETGREQWNPLGDDGQAFRLAVFLDMCVYANRVDEVVSAQAGYYGEHKFYENFYDDMYAATRRAIVRAAAAIGERL